ncbi:MAG: tryptophan synthase subunit beta [Alphaproteobacteria bacterium]
MQSYQTNPDELGRFGEYGGRFVAETLMPLIKELEAAWNEAKTDESFWAEYRHLCTHYVGRPSPLWHAKRLSSEIGGAQIWFKREDCNHTGAHKINNVLGQILLARRMGKKRIIAETGAGQHGVATATVCALFEHPCVVYMGALDVERQKPNVFRMNALGAEVVPVTSGNQTLKDALNEALRDWVSHVDDTFYIIGTVAGPHPYPEMVREFHRIIGQETKEQFAAQNNGNLPNSLVACVGGGSNAIGLFYDFLDEKDIRIVGIEPAGKGIETGEHAASLGEGSAGVLHGNRTYLIQDEDGQIIEPWSISAGLDYPGVGPEHSWLKDQKRVEYLNVTDEEALQAFEACTKWEGIIPALESSHAIAWAMKEAKNLPQSHHMVVNMSGRGDKDMATFAKWKGVNL